MSLFEWFFESRNPGPVGKMGMKNDEPEDDGPPPRKWVIYVTAFIGLLLAGFVLFLIFQSRPRDAGTWVLRLCLFAAYVIASHFLNPMPDRSNIGWAGGLIDNPFRISDDFNRALLLFQLLLLPGKLIAYGLAISWFLCRNLWKKMASNRM